jgi:hypothetical protein
MKSTLLLLAVILGLGVFLTAAQWFLMPASAGRRLMPFARLIWLAR